MREPRDVSMDVERYQPRPVIADVLPAAAGIANYPRCGDKDRASASAQVNDAFARGYLNEDEREARQEAITRSSLIRHLDVLTEDLPPVSRWNGVSQPAGRKGLIKRFQGRQPFSGVTLIVTAISEEVIAGVAAAYFFPGDSFVQALLAAPAITSGVSGVILGIVSLAKKYDW